MRGNKFVKEYLANKLDLGTLTEKEFEEFAEAYIKHEEKRGLDRSRILDVFKEQEEELKNDPKAEKEYKLVRNWNEKNR